MKRRSSWNCTTILAVGCTTLGLFISLCVLGIVLLMADSEKSAKKNLSEANQFWESGRKAEAVAKYEGIISKDSGSIPNDSERAIVYQRLLDYYLSKGDASKAKGLIDRSFDKKIVIAQGSPEATDLIGQVRHAHEQKAALEQANRESEAARQEEERVKTEADSRILRDAEAKRRQQEEESRPKLTAEVVKIRDAPFVTVGGLDTRIVYVDLKNTGNRTIRSVFAKIVAFDAKGKEVYVASDYCIYVAKNKRDGILPGQTHIKKEDEGGHILPPLLPTKPTRVQVQITKVLEEGLE